MEKRNIEFIPKCLVVGFKRKCNSVKHISGDDLFKRFVTANNYCYWNINLKDVFDKFELIGHIQPHCLLISAPDIFIQSVKLAHQKRLLKAPESFVIHFLGDVNSVNCSSTTPSQFVSLDEALCYVIFDLNQRNETSPFDVICCRLAEWYPGLQLPPQFLILATLRNLIDSGQVYYTGYGYNIMTTDKIFVAQWLGDQGPDKSVSRSNSLSNVSVTEKTEVDSRSKSDKVDERRTLRSLDTPQYFSRYYQTPSMCVAPLDESIKRPKPRSMVRQFFSKLKPKNHKSHPPSISATLPNESIYDDESNYYAFYRSQPRFYSSNLEFSPRFSLTTVPKQEASNEDINAKPQWLWRTSLQSLPAGHNSTIRRSSSSHSRLSTTALHDQSPAPIVNSRLRSHRSKSRHRSKSKHSHSNLSRSSSRDKQDLVYGAIDTVQEDSGVHSISESHCKALSNGSNSQYPSSHHRHYKSLPVDCDEKFADDRESISPPIIRDKSDRSTQRLSRSFSTRLSSLSSTNKGLDPVMEASSSKWNGRDDKHVAFKDSYGTAY